MHRLKQAFKHKTPPLPAAGSKPNTIETTYLRQLSQRPQRDTPTDHYLCDLPSLTSRFYVAATAVKSVPAKRSRSAPSGPVVSVIYPVHGVCPRATKRPRAGKLHAVHLLDRRVNVQPATRPARTRARARIPAGCCYLQCLSRGRRGT